MKKMILLIFLTSCSNGGIANNIIDIDKDINFDKDLTFNEYINLLDDYIKIKNYPDIK